MFLYNPVGKTLALFGYAFILWCVLAICEYKECKDAKKNKENE